MMSGLHNFDYFHNIMITLPFFAYNAIVALYETGDIFIEFNFSSVTPHEFKLFSRLFFKFLKYSLFKLKFFCYIFDYIATEIKLLWIMKLD
ncbi:hypothetical protein CVD25_11770 [Bacillus canaveralius]|uniref:Uncharacterized protein n=1 Tax=Bacillus canaveralius TaxID=1403243 RepID=A0A2N5GMU3_9BACI|nr:hypothetical protein CU635_09395 [Bacillus canaveralius]PLR87797.1 hypothetical protein CVD23_01050 [Bacillus sp. V33-4]PLR96693.1 hypothetical protein CVD25_11770 [Bacillus canaveralius]